MLGIGVAALLFLGCFLPLTKASDISPACQHPRQFSKLQQRHGRTLLAVQPPEDSAMPQSAPYKNFIWFNASCHVELDEIVLRNSGVCLLTVSVISGQGETILVGPNATSATGGGYVTPTFPVKGKTLRRSISNSNGVNTVVFQFLTKPGASRTCVVYPVQHHRQHTGVLLYIKDIDECADASRTCHSDCVNTIGSYQCSGCSSSCATSTTPGLERPATRSSKTQQSILSARGSSSEATSLPATDSTVIFPTTTTTNGTQSRKKEATSLLTSTHITLIVVLAVLLIALLVVILIARQCKDGRLSCSMLCMCLRHPSSCCKSRANRSIRWKTRESSEEASLDTEPSAPALVSYLNIGTNSTVTLLPDRDHTDRRTSNASKTAQAFPRLSTMAEDDQEALVSQNTGQDSTYAEARFADSTNSRLGPTSDRHQPLYCAVGIDTKENVTPTNDTSAAQAPHTDYQDNQENPPYALASASPAKSSTTAYQRLYTKPDQPNTPATTNQAPEDSADLYSLSTKPSKGDKQEGHSIPVDPADIYSLPLKPGKDGDPRRRPTHDLGKSSVVDEPEEEAQPPKVVPYKAHMTLKSGNEGGDVTAERPTSLLSAVLYQDPMDALIQEGRLPKQSRPSTEKDASLYASPFELQTRMTLGRAETYETEEEEGGDQQMATSVITAQSTTTAAEAAGTLSLASDASHAQSSMPHNTNTVSATHGYASLSSDTTTANAKPNLAVYSEVIVKPTNKANTDQTALTTSGSGGSQRRPRDERSEKPKSDVVEKVVYTQLEMMAKKGSSSSGQQKAP